MKIVIFFILLIQMPYVVSGGEQWQFFAGVGAHHILRSCFLSSKKDEAKDFSCRKQIDKTCEKVDMSQSNNTSLRSDRYQAPVQSSDESLNDENLNSNRYDEASQVADTAEELPNNSVDLVSLSAGLTAWLQEKKYKVRLGVNLEKMILPAKLKPADTR